MLKAFKLGQEKYEADDYSIKLWVAGEIDNYTSIAEKVSEKKNEM